MKSEVVEILWFLLPGFVSAWIFRGLTASPEISEFERVVQALIFTAFSQAVTFLLRGSLLWLGVHIGPLGVWTTDTARVSSVLIASCLGVLFAWLANNDALHALLRRLRVTGQTSFPSEWFGAFRDHGDGFVVLHLEGERRLFGWAEEWPSDPKRGHFSLALAEWLGEGNKSVPLTDVTRILVPVGQVSFVEFVNPKGDAQ